MVVNASQIFLETSHELLKLGYAVRFRAGGHSMHPTIKDGEMITVEPVNPGDVRRGDILLYQFKKGVIAHRVLRVEREDAQLRFILRGDSTHACDAPVEAGEILGRVISVERKGRAFNLVGRRAKLLRIARARHDTRRV